MNPPGHGTPATQTREWIAYRHMVREAMARWCDAPRAEHLHHAPEGHCIPGCVDVACGECEACQAHEAVMAGWA